MGLFSNGDDTGSRARVAAGQRKAIARDMKAKGLNPVTVSDVRQRNRTGNTPGRAILSTLFSR